MSTVASVPMNLAVGAATRILVAQLAAGTWIKNTDSNNGVYISPDASLQSGQGVYLGPLASTVWQNDADLYACLAAPNVAAVTLTLSASVGNVFDPVADAAATATALLASGVPLTYSNDLLYSNANFPIGPLSPVIDCKNYATLRLGLQNQVVPWTYQQCDDPSFSGLAPIYQDTLFCAGTVMVPVRARYFRIQLAAVASVNGTIIIYGTNRVLVTDNRDIINYNSQTNTVFSYTLNQAYVLNGVYDITPVMQLSGRIFGNWQGLNTAKGVIRLAYPDNVAGPYPQWDNNLAITDTTEWHNEPGGTPFMYKEFIAPRSQWKMQFQCRVAGTNILQFAGVQL